MEIGFLCFASGIFIAMLIAAFSDRLINILLFILLPVLVVALWYFWAFHGVQHFYSELQKSQQSRISSTYEKPEAANANSEEFDKLLPALGQTGDLFGGINALFAALAFSGVAIAAIMQARSLRLAREQQIQQSFEPLFFHLLELHRVVAAPKTKLRSRLQYKERALSSSESAEHAVDFSRAMTVLRRALRMKAVGLGNSDNRGQILCSLCSQYYQYFYDENQDELGPHFRTLFHIFKLIDSASFDLKSKFKYANIARSTLGRDQLFLLAVNCLSRPGQEFKPYVEKYGLLKHVASNPSIPTIDERVASWCYHENARLGASFRLRSLREGGTK